jgi:hypothetical protein
MGIGKGPLNPCLRVSVEQAQALEARAYKLLPRYKFKRVQAAPGSDFKVLATFADGCLEMTHMLAK